MLIGDNEWIYSTMELLLKEKKVKYPKITSPTNTNGPSNNKGEKKIKIYLPCI